MHDSTAHVRSRDFVAGHALFEQSSFIYLSYFYLQSERQQGGVIITDVPLNK